MQVGNRLFSLAAAPLFCKEKCEKMHSLEELGGLGAELVELDLALVVVWHPDLSPAVLVQV